jgi:hypothetical protein
MRWAGVHKDAAREIVGHLTDKMARRSQIVDISEKQVALNKVLGYLQEVEAKKGKRDRRVLRFNAGQR